MTKEEQLYKHQREIKQAIAYKKVSDCFDDVCLMLNQVRRDYSLAGGDCTELEEIMKRISNLKDIPHDSVEMLYMEVVYSIINLKP